MTDEDRRAVALVRLRLWGMHPSWMEYVMTACSQEALEMLADIVEQQPETYAFAKRPRASSQQ